MPLTSVVRMGADGWPKGVSMSCVWALPTVPSVSPSPVPPMMPIMRASVDSLCRGAPACIARRCHASPMRRRQRDEPWSSPLELVADRAGHLQGHVDGPVLLRQLSGHVQFDDRVVGGPDTRDLDGCGHAGFDDRAGRCAGAPLVAGDLGGSFR